jgi:predicted hydrocarbon binding protein
LLLLFGILVPPERGRVNLGCLPAVGKPVNDNIVRYHKIFGEVKMKRKDFLNSACLLGICSCVGMPFLSSSELHADSLIDKKEEDWRIGFMQRRFSKVWDIINSKVGEERKREIIEELGRECAKDNQNFYLKYKDNIEGFLTEIKARWIESAEYNIEEKTIKLVGKKTGVCGCPFVDKSLITKDFCKCSLGYQKEVYEAILGKPVESNIVESVLYGGERCSFIIKVE